MRSYAKLAFFTAFSIALAGGSFFFGLHLGESRVPVVERVAGLLNKDGDVLSRQVDAEPFDFGPYWRVWNTLERKFIPFSTSTQASVPAEDRVYRSIEGLVASYNDPYTEFMRPQRSEDFKMITRGSLEGIGAVIGERDGKLLVVGPLPNSPAEKAGLLAGDYISAVNGESTDPLSVDEAVSKIRGEGGTTVRLTIVREGEETRDVDVVRGTIEIPSTAHAVIEREVPKVAVADVDEPVDTGTEPQPTTGSEEPVAEEPVETEVRDFYLLRLFSFSQTSVTAFERELNEFIENGTDSLIIDLRGNPGGYMEVAVHMAGWFLPKGTVVVREYQGPELKEVVHRTPNSTKFENALPNIAILVDGGSASASEILAGALQEHGIATIVGTKTFGKGSVQELIDITPELALKVTVARWYTPNGVSISNGGLTPDVLVDPTTATSSDPWVDAAIEHLSKKKVVMNSTE
jgi:carboxyl-terminal processing protease